MSEPKPPQDQHPYRRVIKQLAGTLLIGAAGLALVATAVPFDAAAKGGGGNGLDPDVEEMKEAFEDYIDSHKGHGGRSSRLTRSHSTRRIRSARTT